MNIRVKICGITKPDQGRAIAQLGANVLGFICVTQSRRYILPEQIRAIVRDLPLNPVTNRPIDRIGVFANAGMGEIYQTVTTAELNGVQLHGDESPQFCHQLRLALPDVEIVKALRVNAPEVLQQANLYQGYVNTLLLDTYHPNVLGGTGQTLDWSTLQNFRPGCPWFLAGGLNPDNVLDALAQIQPNGIDLSSGVERAPGDKDLFRVQQLFRQLGSLR